MVEDDCYMGIEKEGARSQLLNAAQEASRNTNYLRLNREVGPLEDPETLEWREQLYQHRESNLKRAMTRAKKTLPESEIKTLLRSAEEDGRRQAWVNYAERSDSVTER